MQWIRRYLRNWLLSGEIGLLNEIRTIDTQNMSPDARVFRLQNGFLLECIDRSSPYTTSPNALQFFKTPKEVADALIVHYTVTAMSNAINASVYNTATGIKGANHV